MATASRATVSVPKEEAHLCGGIFLRGMEDAPTDGIRDYCLLLGEALGKAGIQFEQARIHWAECGWLRGLGWLWRESRPWRGRWVLIQYTALQWSRRGFPLGLLAVLAILRMRRARLAVVFHDALPYGGGRLIDGVRRGCQTFVMRWTYRWTDKSVLTVPLERVSWLPSPAPKAVFVSVGSTLLGGGNAAYSAERHDGEKTVAVFGVTGGRHIAREAGDIAHAVRRAARDCPQLRLVVAGRGSAEAEPELRAALEGSGVEISILGILSGPDLKRVFSNADVLLFVRGHISSRRSSAIAALACGLPVVGYAGEETGYPIVEAGVMLVPEGDHEALAEALARVLRDAELRRQLHEKALAAQRQHFAWERVAERFREILE